MAFSNSKLARFYMSAAFWGVGSLVVMLPACSGGGASSGSAPAPSTAAEVIKGTAASGTAVQGTVTLTDSKGVQRTASIGSDGTFSIDVSTMSAPFILMAHGKVHSQDVQYYAPATAEDINSSDVNITPLSDLIVSIIANDLPGICASSTACISKFSKTNVAAAAKDIATKLASTLTAMNLDPTKVDVLHDKISAGSSSGLDGVLDVLSISINTLTKTVTITDLGTSQHVTSDLTNDADIKTPLPAGTGVTEPSLAAQVSARYNEVLNILSSSDSDDVKLSELKPYCSTEFTLHGLNCENGMKEIILQGPLPLDRVSAYDQGAIDQFDGSTKPTDQNVATVAHNNGYKRVLLWKKASDALFYLAGDGGMKASIDLYPEASDFSVGTQTNNVDSTIAIRISVVDDGTGNPVADQVSIAGPGLSGNTDSAVTGDSLLYPNYHDYSALDSFTPWHANFTVYNLALLISYPVNLTRYDPVEVREGVKTSQPYVVTLKKNGNVIATYKKLLRVAPYQSYYPGGPGAFNVTDTSTSMGGTTLKREDGSVARFPKISTPFTIKLAQSGATLSPTIILPEGYQLDAVGLAATNTGAGGSVNWNDLSTFYGTARNNVWAKAGMPITIEAMPWAACAEVNVAAFDPNGHRFMIGRDEGC